MATAETLREFIIDTFMFGEDDGSLKKDTLIFDAGIVDSTGLLEIVAFVEEELSVSVQDEDLVPDNFESIGAMAVYLDGKLAGGEGEVAG